MELKNVKYNIVNDIEFVLEAENKTHDELSKEIGISRNTLYEIKKKGYTIDSVYDKIYSQLEYKLKLKGIILIKQEESFTSQCSPLCDVVNKENASKNKRIHRGLLKDGKYIFNADSVGAFNILRKYYQKNEINKSLTYKCLSNPRKISISVTSYQNEVGVKGRNYPEIIAALTALNSMLGYSIAE